MKLKYLAIGLMMLFCLNVFGQQKKAVPMTVQPQKTEVQVLEETISQLQAENQAIHKQLESMEKEIEICREDVRHKESTINDNQGHWLTVLSIVIGAIVAILGVGLGVVAPILLNLRNDRKQKKNIEKVRAELKNQINSAQQDAKSAKESLSEIIGMKEDIEIIKKDIDKSKKAAERAAKRAMASKLFTQALSEKNSLKAIELYSKVLEIMPYYAEVYNNRGVLQIKLGNKDEALKDLDKAIELVPDDVEYFVNRGLLKAEMDNVDEALKDFAKAIEINPDFPGIYNDRADLWLSIGKLEDALVDINEAISKDNNDPVFYVTRGEIYFAKEMFNEAVADFSNALKMNDGIKEAFENRAKCYRKLAETENDETKNAELIAKAEADEEKAKTLKKE